MNTISLKLSSDAISLLKKTYPNNIIESKNPYVDTEIRLSDAIITIYKSEKVVFVGEGANYYASLFMTKKIHPEAGSDEVGTGVYFGPICVCAAILKEEDHDLLTKYRITDSKQLSDDEIIKTAPELIKKIEYSLLILKPIQYNDVYRNNNMVAIKTKMHNQAYINLLHKGYKIPKAAYVDQFVAENIYFKYLINEKEVYHDLIFETKAESKHPAVACASIIARYAFIKEMEAMEKHYALSFHKGAGEETDKDAYIFVNKYGLERLKEVAKLHFKNTEKVKETITKKAS